MGVAGCRIFRWRRVAVCLPLVGGIQVVFLPVDDFRIVKSFQAVALWRRCMDAFVAVTVVCCWWS